MTRSNENYLRWKFGQSVAKGHATNVTLIARGEESGVALESGESAIANIELRSESTPILLTDMRLCRGNETLVWFEDVKACVWIDRDDKTAAKLKATKFHRVILDLHDGREVVIEDLGQAVFPLLNFFGHKLDRRSRRL